MVRAPMSSSLLPEYSTAEHGLNKQRSIRNRIFHRILIQSSNHTYKYTSHPTISITITMSLLFRANTVLPLLSLLLFPAATVLGQLSLVPAGLLDFVPESCEATLNFVLLPCAIENLCLTLLPSDEELDAIPAEEDVESCEDIEVGLCPITSRCPPCKTQADDFFKCIIFGSAADGALSQNVTDIVAGCDLACDGFEVEEPVPEVLPELEVAEEAPEEAPAGEATSDAPVAPMTVVETDEQEEKEHSHDHDSHDHESEDATMAEESGGAGIRSSLSIGTAVVVAGATAVVASL